MQLTPLGLQILLHYHMSFDPHPEIDSMSVCRSIAEFLENEVLKESDKKSRGCYVLTDKGRAWLKCIFNTPMPRQKTVWVDENNKIIPV